jgi:hypothetical protein
MFISPTPKRTLPGSCCAVPDDGGLAIVVRDAQTRLTLAGRVTEPEQASILKQPDHRRDVRDPVIVIRAGQQIRATLRAWHPNVRLDDFADWLDMAATSGIAI